MSTPQIRIVWNEGTVGAWADRFAALDRSTLPQSYGYARAMARTHGFLPRLGLIEREGEAAGLVQVLERRVLRIACRREIHRGPLWFAGPPDEATLAETLVLLRRACPDNLLNRLSFLPELPMGGAAARALEQAGFRRFGPGYRTVWIDLTLSLAAIRAGFSATWRQRLKSAEKAGLRVDLDESARMLPWLMKQEREQAVFKHFRPLSGPLAVRLRNALVGQAGLLLAIAHDEQGPVAAGLFLGHGGCATYQVGWSGERGRKSHAMRLVLWHAIRSLRERGYRALDLGGINPDTAPGVTEFKLAMGGEAVETIGLYR